MPTEKQHKLFYMSFSALQPGKRYVMLRDFFFLDLWLLLSMEWGSFPIKVSIPTYCRSSSHLQYILQAIPPASLWHSEQWTVTILKDMKSSQLLHISTIQRNDNNSKRLQKRGWETINGCETFGHHHPRWTQTKIPDTGHKITATIVLYMANILGESGGFVLKVKSVYGDPKNCIKKWFEYPSSHRWCRKMDMVTKKTRIDKCSRDTSEWRVLYIICQN